MTIQTPSKSAPQPKPVGPRPVTRPPAGPSPERPTAPLDPVAADAALDGLPLLDNRSRRRTVAAGLASRGHYLALQNGPETRLLRIGDGITHVGRGPEVDISFDEQRVSRSHAVLVQHGRYFRVLDNRSSNGTFVNGRSITATNLDNGDVIRVGPVVMQYLVVS